MQRYQAIEQAYCDSRWREVLREGERLLDEVRRGDFANAEGLEDRLQLLLGHTHLYGFGDRDAAEDHYSAVLASRADTSLRQIAQEGLDQCNLPRMAAGETSAEELEGPDALDGPELPQAAATPMPLELPVQAAAEPLAEPLAEEPAWLQPTAMPGGAAPSGVMPAMPWQSDGMAGDVPVDITVDATTAATPWLIKTPDPAPAPEPMPEATLPRLQPEVLEEPEQIEVHQAIPELADELVLEPIEPIRPVELAWSPEEPAGVQAATAPAPVAAQPLDQEPLNWEPAQAPVLGVEPELVPEPSPSVPAPAPAAEEDPELLRGLLRVEIR